MAQEQKEEDSSLIGLPSDAMAVPLVDLPGTPLVDLRSSPETFSSTPEAIADTLVSYRCISLTSYRGSSGCVMSCVPPILSCLSGTNHPERQGAGGLGGVRELCGQRLVGGRNTCQIRIDVLRL